MYSTTISSTVKTIQDNMIELASGSPADTLDTGIYMRYTQDGNVKSSGIYRSASDGRFFFYNYNADVLPGATVDAVSSYYEKAHVSVNNLNVDGKSILLGRVGVGSGGAPINNALTVVGLDLFFVL